MAHRILVIDDRRDARLPLVIMLRRLGHDVREAESGEIALQIAHEYIPSIILCDINLAGMDGYAVAQAIRAAKETASAKMVALTGFDDDRSREQAQQAGFDHHLTKPIGLTELNELLRRFSNGH